MSIEDFREKIKPYGGEEGNHRLFVISVLVLASAFSFGIGRISVAQPHTPIQVGHFDALPGVGEAKAESLEKPTAKPALTQPAAVSEAVKPIAAPASKPKITSESVFASKSGTRYYPQDCKAGSSVAEANRIWFENAAAAQTLGLSLGVGCK